MPASSFSPKTCDRFVIPLVITIRTCREEDLPELEWHGMFTQHREIIRDAWESYQRGENVMLVATVRDAPIGQVWIDLRKKRDERAGVVWALRVFPFLRQMGIGKRLLGAAEELLRRRGWRHVELGVEKGSLAAKFYERLGYRRSATLYEEYSYTTPEGVPMTVPVDQIIYRKTLQPIDAKVNTHVNSATPRRSLDDR